MAFGRKVDDYIELLFFTKLKNKLAVTDITENKAEIIATCIVESVKVSCISKSIKAYRR